MTVSLVGANAQSGQVPSLPTHQGGDLLLVWAVSGSQTLPTVPSGWTTIESPSDTGSAVLAYSFAPSSGTSGGTWPGAVRVASAVYRGVTDIGVSVSDAGSGFYAAIPALTPPSPTWLVAFASTGVGTSTWPQTRASNSYGAVLDTGGDSSGMAADSIYQGSPTAWATAAVALVSTETHATSATLPATFAMSTTATVYEGERHAATAALSAAFTLAASVTGRAEIALRTAYLNTPFTISTATTVNQVFPPNPGTPPPRDVDAVLAGSGPRRCWVEVLSGPAQGETLPVTGGSITEDLAADVRRTGSLTVAGLPEWVPEDATDALDVRAGTEVQIWIGVTDDEGVEHAWSQGVFRPSRPAVSRGNDGLQITVEVSDRAHAVGLSRIRRRWAATAGTGIIESCVTVLAEVAPWLPIDISLEGDIPLGTDAILAEYGEDVWKMARTLLDGLGLDLHIDEHGVAVAPEKIDPLTATPHVLPGLLAVSVSTDVEDVVNVIGCPWEEARPEDAPEGWVPDGGIEEAVDETSSTSIHTPLGTRARLYEGDTSVIHAPPHARLAAQSQLINEMDLQRAASGSMIPDPRVKVGVPVEVEGHVHRVTRLTIDLAGGETGVDFGASVPQIFRLLASRPVAVERETTEIVTAVNPLRSRPVTEPGGPETVVEWTDAVKGVEVGDPIRVRHKGVGRRVAVAILVHKSVQDRYAGESLGTVGGAGVTVGGDTQLRARIGSNGSYRTFSGGDVTLPEPPQGVTASQFNSHTHPIPDLNIYVRADLPMTNADNVSGLRTALNSTREAVNSMLDNLRAIESRFTNEDTFSPN